MSANPLTSTLAALLESAANGAIATNPSARAELAALDDQILLLELSTLPSAPPLAIRINCLATGGGSLRIMADTVHNARAPHAIVRGSVADVVASLFRDNLPASISIEGDERLMMALKRCFSGLAPQWRKRLEEFAARASAVTGTNSAPLMQDMLGQAELAFDTLRATLGDLLGNASDRASAESAKHWAQNNDLDEFATRLENLQLSLDRLHAQVDQIAASRQPPEPTPNASL